MAPSEDSMSRIIKVVAVVPEQRWTISRDWRPNSAEEGKYLSTCIILVVINVMIATNNIFFYHRIDEDEFCLTVKGQVWDRQNNSKRINIFKQICI